MPHTTHVYVSRILLTTVLFLLGVASLAAGDSRWYLNAKLGQGSLDVQFDELSPKQFDDQNETGSFEVGFVLHRHLAVQAVYHDLGEYRGFGLSCGEDVLCLVSDPSPIRMTADVSGLSLSVVPRLLLLDDRLTVYGKLGVIDWDIDVSGELGFRDSLSGSDLLSGIGVRYGLKNGFGVIAEYERFDLNQESASLGASWRF